jgi:hypothetical protein
MKILQDPAASAGTSAKAPGAEGGLARLEALEKSAAAVLQRLQALEERIKTLEKAPKHAAAAPASDQGPRAVPSPLASMSSMAPPTAALDMDAVRKGLLTRMWKYLNDADSPKAA